MSPIGKLWTYNQSLGIYRCPADKSEAVIGGKRYPRTRSISMNGNMNGSVNWSYDKDFYYYRRLSDNVRPSPSPTWVFIDEREQSIGDGYFLVFLSTKFSRPGQWGNLPAIYHNHAAGFSFADGHAEVKRWLDPETTRTLPKNRDALPGPLFPHGTWRGFRSAPARGSTNRMPSLKTASA